MTSDKWVLKTDVASSHIGDDLALLDPASRQYFTLNETGAAIWSALSSPQSIEDLQKIIAEKFDVAQQDCADDIAALMDQLNKAGLIGKA